jgi:ligand-binding sensor protein
MAKELADGAEFLSFCAEILPSGRKHQAACRVVNKRNGMEANRDGIAGR